MESISVTGTDLQEVEQQETPEESVKDYNSGTLDQQPIFYQAVTLVHTEGSSQDQAGSQTYHSLQR